MLHSYITFFLFKFHFFSQSGPFFVFESFFLSGTVTYSGVVMVVTARLAIECSYWTIFHLFFPASILLYFIATFIRSLTPFPDEYYSGIMVSIVQRPAFWLFWGLMPIACVMIRDYSWKYLKHRCPSKTFISLHDWFCTDISRK